MKLSKFKFLGIALFVVAMVFMGCSQPAGMVGGLNGVGVILDQETNVPAGYYVNDSKGVYIQVNANGSGAVYTKEDDNWKTDASATLTKVVYYTATLSSCDCLGKTSDSKYFKDTYDTSSKKITVSATEVTITVNVLKGATLTYQCSQPTGSSS